MTTATDRIETLRTGRIEAREIALVDHTGRTRALLALRNDEGDDRNDDAGPGDGVALTLFDVTGKPDARFRVCRMGTSELKLGIGQEDHCRTSFGPGCGVVGLIDLDGSSFPRIVENGRVVIRADDNPPTESEKNRAPGGDPGTHVATEAL